MCGKCGKGMGEKRALRARRTIDPTGGGATSGGGEWERGAAQSQAPCSIDGFVQVVSFIGRSKGDPQEIVQGRSCR